MQPTIRPATAADTDAIGELIRAEGMPPFEFERFLDTFWVLESDDEIVGCIGLEVYGSAALLRSIVTAPSIRGSGGGHVLTTRWLDEARARGATTGYLFTMDKAPFFSRYGFELCTMDDWDEDARQTTQYAAMSQAPEEFRKLITTMRLTL
jgi:amino-acid N-acetyltransferase